MTKTQNDQPETVKLHPRTGELLEPLFTWHGGAVWPVFGGADGDDDGGDGSDSEQNDDDEGGDGEGNDKDKGEKPVSRSEFDKLRNQLSAADKARAAAEKKLKDQDDAKKDELTKATERVAELEKSEQAKDKEIAGLRLHNAFLSADTGITWQDPADALALAERGGYLAEVVGEDGNVDAKALSSKLKELAKAKPHLVKSGSETLTPSAGVRTGGSVGSTGSKGKKDGPDLSRYERILNR